MEIFNGKFTRTAPRVFRGDLLNLPSGAASFFDLFGTPKLGYSLMNLSGLNSNATRTRRTSDNSEINSKPASIKGGALLNWVNTDIDLYTSDFSLGISPFLVSSGASAAAPITKAGESDTLRLTADSSTGQHYVNMAGPFNVDGSNVAVSFDYYIPSTNSAVDGVRLWNGFGGDGQVIGSAINAWTNASGVITNNDGTNLRIQMTDGGAIPFSGALNDEIFIKNIVVTQTNASGKSTTLYNTGSAASSDLTQTTAARQPEIIHLGSLETISGDPAINWSYNAGVLHKVSDTDFKVSDTFSIDIDFETSSDVSTRQTLVINRDGASDIVGLAVFAGRLYFEGFNGSPAGGYVSISANTRYKATLVWNGATFSAAFVNGASSSITSTPAGLLGNATTGSLQLGGHVASTANPFLGKLTSLLFYTEAKDLAHNIGFNAAY